MNDSSSSRLVDPDMDNPVVQQHAQSYVPVEVNGYKTVFLLDTGATTSILSKVHAIKLGILDGQCEPEYISVDSKSKMRQLLVKYQDAYDMGYCDLVPDGITLKPGTQPIRLPPYRVGYHAILEIEKHVDELLKKGIIGRTYSVTI